MNGAALLRGFAPGTPIGWRRGHAITWERLLAAATAFAQKLPAGGYCVNLCDDRLNFLLGYAAALVARATSLLPQSRAPEVINALAQSHAGSVLITDAPDEAASGLARIDASVWPKGEATGVAPDIPLDHQAAILFTSGSTGAPRAHIKTWGSLVRGSAAVRERLPLAPGSALLGAVPPQHMWGFETTVMLPMQSGCAVAACCPLLPAEIAAALEALPPPRWLVATPLHLRACSTAGERLPALAGALSATAPLAGELASEVEQRYAAPLFEIYGSTETGTFALRRPAHTEVFETLGGITLAHGPGGAAGRGGHLAEPVMLNDVIELQDATHFVLRGRTQDMVKIGGKRGSLTALNAELARAPGVRDSVMWLPDQDGATEPRLAAFVVAPGRTPEEIFDYLRQRLDSVFLPRPLVIVDTLPRNRTGKLTHESLRALVAAHVRGDVLPPAQPGVTQVVSAAHPALPFHFPGDPLVPGVWLLALVENAARERYGAQLSVCGVPDARFRRVLRPMEPFSISLDRSAPDCIAFRIDAGDARIADGTLAVREHP